MDIITQILGQLPELIVRQRLQPHITTKTEHAQAFQTHRQVSCGGRRAVILSRGCCVHFVAAKRTLALGDWMSHQRAFGPDIAQ